MSSPRTVSVIICTHQISRFGRLGQAIGSVLGQSLPPDELVLVVDGNDAVLQAARRELPGVRVLPNTRRRGLSGARNTGVLAASGDIVAFIDDDAVADPGWLEAVVTHFDTPFTLGVGGPIVPDWPEKRPQWMPPEFDWVVGCSYEGQATAPGTIRNLIGCNMAFRRSALVMAGLFTEDLGRVGGDAGGAEETDLCLRARAMFPAAAFVHEPKAVVHHQIEQHRTGLDYFMKRCIAEGRSKALMARRHPAGGGLLSERRHLLGMPKRILAHLAQGFADRRTAGFARAGASVLGTALVGGSFLVGQVRFRRVPRPAPAFAPFKIVDVDLSHPVADITASAGGDASYGAAHLVIRDRGRMLAVTQLPLFGEDLAKSEVEALVAPYRDGTAPEPELDVPQARVVVATRDRTVSLARCLDSLLAQDYPNFEIAVVDNAPSDDETRRMIEDRYAGSGKVRYLLEERPGLALAHNRGLDDLTAEFVAFTDDDVVADKSWLSSLMRPFAESEEVGCVTGSIVPAELDTRAQYWTEMHGGFLKSVRQQAYDLDANRSDNPLFPYAAGMFGSGANMAFRREVLADIGGFDPLLGAGTATRGGDDLAAFAETVLRGHRLVYNPDALVWHFHRSGEEGMQRQAFGYGMGLGAYLTRLVVTGPHRLTHFASVAPAAARHIFSSKSAKNIRLPVEYPAKFVWLERLGILAGGLAYLRSRAATRYPGKWRRAVPSKHAWKST